MTVQDRRTGRIIGAAIEVHRALEPGLLESAYAACLAVEFVERGIPARGQVALPVTTRASPSPPAIGWTSSRSTKSSWK